MAKKRVANVSKKKRTTLYPPSKVGKGDVPQIIIDKVQQFEEHLDTYRSPGYSEAQLRIDFINPMLKALGWDVDNERGHAEAYREVVYEDALKVGGTSKAPDYGFYIGGRASGGGRKFFLEAKKPDVALRLDPKPTFQLRRYAYSAKLPLSILTNFRDFLVLDTRLKPDGTANKVTGVILALNYQEYPERWDEIASVFSREAILRGSFDKFAQQKRTKATQPLDEAFLSDIEDWREILAQDFAKQNPGLSVEDLNFAVQRTIDRILFLRICEDRGIENPHALLAVTNGDKVYARLGEIFRNADDRYNSGIFHFPPRVGRKADPDRTEEPDDLTLDLTLDDQPIRKIIKGLYDHQHLYTTYSYSLIPPDILGQVYEQFLGKVITLSPKGRKVDVVERPEVRKAGGVYYTPDYIVKYIVEHTVGKLLEGKTPREAAKIRILDPASGSGSFLIGAYQYLLDWHFRWYIDHDPDSHCQGKSPPLTRFLAPSFADDAESDRQAKGKGERYEYRLSTHKRREILLNSIYGVDIDAQAVEVTKLSLLLKVLEGESQESLAAQKRFFHLRALPDLGKNIKCGNSLISDDFDDSDLSDEERRKINAFNWSKGFPAIMKAGGFDAVIGNPPYIFGEYHNALTKPYLESKYQSAIAQYDTYWLFIELGLQITRRSGRFSLIVPDALLARDECSTVRRLLLESGIHRLYHCGLVFLAGVSAVVFAVAKGMDSPSISVDTREGSAAVERHHCSVTRFLDEERFRLLIHATDEEASLLTRVMGSHEPLRTYGKISRGEEIGKKHVRDSGRTPILVGADISRYSMSSPTRFIRKASKNSALYRSPKIVIVKTGSQCIASIDNGDSVTMQSVYNLHLAKEAPPIECVLAVLNSRLIRWFVEKTFTAYKLLFPQLNQTTIEELPIANPSGNVRSRMVKHVDRMLEMHKALAAAGRPQEKERLRRDIESTDSRIDALVYELYGLTDDEIRFVEEATGEPTATEDEARVKKLARAGEGPSLFAE
ncbi:MAG: N-6 DNA methylase [Phycisphaerales bacterium]|nr:N-6 DNA methylase [Phycisphaerales bacterium]